MKRTLSILLALAMLLSVIPMTALTTAAADDEIAATGSTYGVSTGEALIAMLEKDNPSGEGDMTINVNADISYYVTTQGVTGLDSYLRYACTVGKGKKILNLNGHKLHFYNDYVVIDACNGYSISVINNLNRQCLFLIPDGADLTVNGDASGSVDSGLIQYHGKLLNKCDAVDQRDIFEIRGGNLTINSGRYLAGGEVTSYEWHNSIDILPGVYVPTDEKAWYLVGGDAIRALAGNLTVNGGYFEGRGLSGYSLNCNEALYAEVGMSSVVINDGHFNGRSGADVVWAETLIQTGRFTVNSGIFELDKNETTVGTVYRSYDYSVYGSGRIGVFFPNADPNTLYYYKENADSDYVEVPSATVKSDDLRFFRFSEVYQAFVEPKLGHRPAHSLSATPTGELGFICQGKKYAATDDINWRVGDSMKVYVDPACLYFEDQKASSYGVSQSLSSTVRFNLMEYISDSNQPVIYEGETVTLSKDSSGNYYIDLNNLSTKVKNKLESGKTYAFQFTATENWKSRREFGIYHTGKLCVTISTDVSLFGCEITEPAYGKKPSNEVVYSDLCYDVELTWMERKTTDDLPQDMDTSLIFKRDRLYTAFFTVTMKSGYSRADDFSFYVNGRKVQNATKMTYGFIAFVEYDMRADQIGMVQLNDVPEPVAGEYAYRSYTVPEGENYRVKAQTGGGYQMYWYKENGATLQPTDAFEAGRKYKLRANIETTDGYQFVDSPTVLINGHYATVKSNFDNRELTVEYLFTCPATVTTLDSISAQIVIDMNAALPYNATVPAGFGYSVEEYGDGTYWKNGVKWTDAEGNNLPIGTVPEYGKTYTAWVSLEITDTDGYQFAPADEITAYLNGQKAEVCEYDEYNYGVYYTFIIKGSPYGNCIVGDADTDKNVTILDATAIQRVLASLPVTAFDEKAADADEDGNLTILDATAIQRHLAALPTNPNIGTVKG